VVEQMAHTLAAEPGSPRMPGDPEHVCEVERRRTGIPVEPQLARQMHDWSVRLGVEPPLRTIAQG
jgi:ureidoglycolate dehydrogenase (NAD+)